MAFQLGFAGGFADAGGETPPEQPPVAVGGGASVLVRRQWITRPFEIPRPLPVSARARTRVHYRLSARVAAVRPIVRVRPLPVDLAVRRVGLVMVARAPVRIATKVISTITVDPKALSRTVAEMRELNELAVVLSLLE